MRGVIQTLPLKLKMNPTKNGEIPKQKLLIAKPVKASTKLYRSSASSVAEPLQIQYNPLIIKYNLGKKQTPNAYILSII